MALPTLLDIATRNGTDAVVGLVDETIQQTPELSGMFNGTQIPNVGSMRTISGTSFKTRVRTGLPTVAFRDVNEGVAADKSTVENKRVECYLLNPKFTADKALADASEDGPEAYLAEEAGAIMEASWQHLASQFYYGTGNDAKGFPGLQAAYDSAMEVDAGGTTANTGSSVYAVRFGPRNVQWILGNNGSLNVSDVRIGDVSDGTNDYTAYIQELMAWIGVSVQSKWSVGRIKNVTEDAGKGLTDDLLADLYNKFKAGRPPHAFFMSKRSHGQLRKSRTATNPTGAPAPFPTDWMGIPIIATEALLDTEAIA